MSDGTFSATESESVTIISGTYSTTTTGFQKLVVTARSGAQAPAVGAVIGCTEIPSFAFICGPILASEDQVVGTIATGTCPSADFSNNFINLQFNTTTIDMGQTTGGFSNGSGGYEGDLFGTFDWDAANSQLVPGTHYVVAGGAGYTSISGGNDPLPMTCSNGIISATAFNAYLAPGAGFLKVKEASSPNFDNGIIIMPKSTLSALTAMNGDYSGFLYDATKTGANTVVPVSVTISGTSTVAMTVSGLSKTDLTTADATISGTATLTAANSPSAGFILGNISGHNVVCMAGKDVLGSGKNAMYCLGRNPGDTAKPYMLMLGSN